MTRTCNFEKGGDPDMKTVCGGQGKVVVGQGGFQLSFLMTYFVDYPHQRPNKNDHWNKDQKASSCFGDIIESICRAQG